MRRSRHSLAAERRAGTWCITETGFVYQRMIDDADDADWSDLLPRAGEQAT